MKKNRSVFKNILDGVTEINLRRKKGDCCKGKIIAGKDKFPDEKILKRMRDKLSDPNYKGNSDAS